MKSVIFRLILFFLLSLPLSSLEWQEDFMLFGLGWDPYYTMIGKHGDELVFGRIINDKKCIDIKNISDLYKQDDGYYIIKIFGKNAVAIFGGNYFFIHDSDTKYSMYQQEKNYTEFDNLYTVFENSKNESKTIGDRYKNIDKISIPDFLVENVRGKEIKYNTDSMFRYYARMLDGHVVCNPDSIPWATRKNPLGMQIEIEFGTVQSITSGMLINKSDHLVVLNGYVNPLKRNLYKENRRLKKIKIESIDVINNFSFIVDFSDEVGFKRISFPESVNKVRITIIDFYEGSKYKDLCVQMIGTDFDLYASQESLSEYQKNALLWINK